MKKNEDSRRTFLKSLLAGSAVAAGAATATKPSRAAVKKQKQTRTEEVLYRETDEFKRYYQSLEY